MSDSSRNSLGSLKELWRQAKKAISKHNWSLMKKIIEEMVDSCKKFRWFRMRSDIRSPVAEMFLEAGKECAACMAFHLAKDCFEQVIEIDGLGRPSDALCDAIECLTQIYLQTDDITSIRTLRSFRHLNLRFAKYSPVVLIVLGRAYMELGLALVKRQEYVLAMEHLMIGEHKLKASDPDFFNSASYASISGAMGYCLYMESEFKEAMFRLKEARLVWRNLNWPIEHLQTIVHTLKNYMVCMLRVYEWNQKPEEAFVNFDLLSLHNVFKTITGTNTMIIADVFYDLGREAQRNQREETAWGFYHKARNLEYEGLADSSVG